MESCEGIYRLWMSCMTSSHDVNQGAAREATRGISLVLLFFLFCFYFLLVFRVFLFVFVVSTGRRTRSRPLGRGRAYYSSVKKKNKNFKDLIGRFPERPAL